jgi:asparagine N-glycosylation enzyme membrane subunit Stt3
MNTFLGILTFSFTLICLIFAGKLMGNPDQGTFVGGLMVGCFWLGWLFRNIDKK